jgi:hypothetical protein
MQGDNQDSNEQKLSELYSELSQEQPSAALDEKILAEAHKAVAPQKPAAPFSTKWTVPASLAAVIVLSVMVVTVIEKKQPDVMIGIPEPAKTQAGGVPDRQMLDSEGSEEISALVKDSSRLNELAGDRDTSVSRSMAKREIKPGESAIVSPVDTGLEKKKSAAVLAKRAPSLRLSTDSSRAVERKESLPAKPQQHEIAASVGREPEQDTELAASSQNKEALLMADEYRSSQPLAKIQQQSSQKLQPARKVVTPALKPAAPAAGFSTPQTVAQQASKEDKAATCRGLSETACLKSPDCILQQAESKSGYQCRVADNSCEERFIQSIHLDTDCDVKKGCKYVPANCYCAPGKICQCSGGTPAMCVTAQEE